MKDRSRRKLKRVEIHALEYAVCTFLHHLDLLMWTGWLGGWRRPSFGLNLEMKIIPLVPGDMDVPDQVVLIRPGSWPKPSNVSLCLRFSNSWRVISGTIRHPMDLSTPLSFDVSNNTLLPEIAAASDPKSREILGPVLERAKQILGAHFGTAAG